MFLGGCPCCGKKEGCSNPCDVPGHNAGYLLGDQMLNRFFNYGDDITSLDLRINGKRQSPFFVEFESNRELRAYSNSFAAPLSHDSSLNLNIEGSPTIGDYDCGYINGFVTFVNVGDPSEKSALYILFQDFFGSEFRKPESAQFSVYGPTENSGFYGNILYLNTVSFGGITWTNPYPLPPALLTPTVVTFYDSTWCDPKNRTRVSGYTDEELVEVPVKDFAGTISGTFTVYKTNGMFLRTEDFSLQWPELISVHSCPPCSASPGGRTMTTTTTGPGTYLANMLKAWGIHPKENGKCGCKSMEKKMNRLGSACKQPKNLKMIVDHLQAEAKKRNLPFVRKVGEMLVLRAVKKFEKNS